MRRVFHITFLHNNRGKDEECACFDVFPCCRHGNLNHFLFYFSSRLSTRSAPTFILKMENDYAEEREGDGFYFWWGEISPSLHCCSISNIHNMRANGSSTLIGCRKLNDEYFIFYKMSRRAVFFFPQYFFSNFSLLATFIPFSNKVSFASQRINFQLSCYEMEGGRLPGPQCLNSNRSNFKKIYELHVSIMRLSVVLCCQGEFEMDVDAVKRNVRCSKRRWINFQQIYIDIKIDVFASLIFVH